MPRWKGIRVPTPIEHIHLDLAGSGFGEELGIRFATVLSSTLQARRSHWLRPILPESMRLLVSPTQLCNLRLHEVP